MSSTERLRLRIDRGRRTEHGRLVATDEGRALEVVLEADTTAVAPEQANGALEDLKSEASEDVLESRRSEGCEEEKPGDPGEAQCLAGEARCLAPRYWTGWHCG